MANPRRVEPEWLDELPAEDPRAMRSRRDLARVNGLMANAGIVARELRSMHPGPPAWGLPGQATARIAEIGAGDGEFALRLANLLPPAPGASFTLLDRQGIVKAQVRGRFEDLGWKVESVERDVFEWLEDPSTPAFDAIVANLFLHHFEADALARMLQLVSRKTSRFVACEPRRSDAALLGSRLLGLAGCNDVTRHDAVVSVRAGFRDGELAALWPQAGWTTRERARGLFSHCFAAWRP
jgi:SAM-dependent methyltransferase